MRLFCVLSAIPSSAHKFTRKNKIAQIAPEKSIFWGFAPADAQSERRRAVYYPKLSGSLNALMISKLVKLNETSSVKKSESASSNASTPLVNFTL